MVCEYPMNNPGHSRASVIALLKISCLQADMTLNK